MSLTSECSWDYIQKRIVQCAKCIEFEFVLSFNRLLAGYVQKPWHLLWWSWENHKMLATLSRTIYSLVIIQPMHCIAIALFNIAWFSWKHIFQPLHFVFYHALNLGFCNPRIIWCILSSGLALNPMVDYSLFCSRLCILTLLYPYSKFNT